MKNRIIIASVLALLIFLAGFVPQYMRAKRLETDLAAARQGNALAELRDLAGLAFVQASQKNYGLAAGTNNRLFRRAREVVKEATGRKALEDLLPSEAKISAGLAKGDAAALGDLQTLFEKIREATGPIER